jgi:beta-glucosidase
VKPPYEITPRTGLEQKCEDKIEIIDDVEEAEYVFLVLGLDHEEHNDVENSDRESLELPEAQLDLIDEVTEKNENIIVILINGSPIRMDNWINKVKAIIEAWYPGQEGGHVIADIIFGDVNPSGKLPLTFPKRLEDSPAHLTEKRYPGNEKVFYEENIFVGYRYFDTQNIKPLFPFGFGLSYTNFKYKNIELDKTEFSDNEKLTVSLKIENIGKRKGAEIIQLYLREVHSKVERPVKELKGFKKVILTPNQIKTLQFEITKEALSYYDDDLKFWNVNEGEYEVFIGSSSQDIRLEEKFNYIKKH